MKGRCWRDQSGCCPRLRSATGGRREGGGGCTSRYTVRRRTSRDRTKPTRWGPSDRWRRCCRTVLDCRRKRRRWKRRSKRCCGPDALRRICGRRAHRQPPGRWDNRYVRRSGEKAETLGRGEKLRESMGMGRTIIQKVWDSHVVHEEAGAPTLLFIDLHLVHEVTSPQAFQGLRERGIKVRRPDLTIATADHGIPTTDRRLPIVDEIAAKQLAQLETNCAEFGIRCLGIHSSLQGIVHVIGPELGLTQPGMTVVCGDSHTATHGAFGALAFGIGTSEVEHVLATQCLLQRKSKTFQVLVDGELRPGVTAEDIILALIARIGVGGGTAYIFEYRGPAIRALAMEERMTVCNMSIEGGARAGMVAPDDTTFEYLAGRPHAPKGADWDAALARWKQLPTDEGAAYDQSIAIGADRLEPMI